MKKADYREIIETLVNGNFYAECPICDEAVALRNAGLFSSDDLPERAIEIRELQLKFIQMWKEKLIRLREIGAARSTLGARSGNIGRILERLAPTFGSFRF